MEITLDCIPCMLKQALDSSRMVTDDVVKHAEIMEEAIAILINYRQYRNSPDLAREIHRAIRRLTGVEDSYYEIKQRDLKAAKELYPFLKEFLIDNKNELYWALKIAATGNNIDAAIDQNIDVKKCVASELERKFAKCDLDILQDKLKTAANILVIGDNSGETVFDKVLIENLLPVNIIYAVRSAPILNDATIKEAYESGLGQVSQVISTGCDAPGTIIEDCDEVFIELFNKADIIISKGQGNYEALSERDENIFFLLKAKCPMISKKLNVNLNDYVFVYNGKDNLKGDRVNHGETNEVKENR